MVDVTLNPNGGGKVDINPQGSAASSAAEADGFEGRPVVRYNPFGADARIEGGVSPQGAGTPIGGGGALEGSEAEKKLLAASKEANRSQVTIIIVMFMQKFKIVTFNHFMSVCLIIFFSFICLKVDEAIKPVDRYQPSDQVLSTGIAGSPLGPPSLSPSEQRVMQGGGGTPGITPPRQTAPSAAPQRAATTTPSPPGTSAAVRHGFTPEEALRLAAQGGTTTVTGPGSLVIAGGHSLASHL